MNRGAVQFGFSLYLVVPAPIPGAAFADGHDAPSIAASGNPRSVLAARARSTAQTYCGRKARPSGWKWQPPSGQVPGGSVPERRAGADSIQRQAAESSGPIRKRLRESHDDADATPQSVRPDRPR